MDTPQIDRETWLTQAAELILDDVLLPLTDSTDHPPFRVSVGWPTGRHARRALAVCHPRSASDDGKNELFVSPVMDDSLQILAALVHELIHAIDDCQHGHRGPFATLARRAGLEGPLTATTAGDALTATLEGYVTLLGPIPHARLRRDRLKKQSTRMLKLHCTSCGFIARTAAKWLHVLPPDATCPVCNASTLNPSD